MYEFLKIFLLQIPFALIPAYALNRAVNKSEEDRWGWPVTLGVACIGALVFSLTWMAMEYFLAETVDEWLYG